MKQPEKTLFSIFLSEIMQRRKLTQAELASKASTTQATISRYLRGIAMPRAEELHRISLALGVTMEWLLTGQGPVNAAPSSPKPTKTLSKALSDAESAIARARREVGS